MWATDRNLELGGNPILFFERFDFIECFTTTFLHTHSWLNWVDEDEVGLKEKPEETSKRLHLNKTRSTGSVDKGI